MNDHVFIIAEMVRAVRATEAALGTPNYEVIAQNRRFARSLYIVFGTPLRMGMWS